MKATIAAALWLGTISVAAQASSDDIVYVTEYYSAPCNTTASGYTQTLTGTVTQTYCPECEGQATSSSPPGGVLTTYTTALIATCPTGTTMKTYTITEPCPTPGLPLPSGYIPQGFTVTTVSCSICPTPGPVVITAPVSSPPAATGPLVSSSPAVGVPPPASTAGSSPPVPTSPASGGASPGGAAPGGAAPGGGSSSLPIVNYPAAIPTSPFSAPNNQSVGAAGGPGASSTPNAVNSPISTYTPGSGSTVFKTPWDLLALLSLSIPVIYIL